MAPTAFMLYIVLSASIYFVENIFTSIVSARYCVCLFSGQIYEYIYIGTETVFGHCVVCFSGGSRMHKSIITYIRREIFKCEETAHHTTDRGLCRFRAFLPKNVYVYDYVCATIILWLFANGLHKIVCSLWRLGITDTCMHTQIRTNMFNGFATHVQSIPTPHTTRVRCSSAHSSVFVAALATATAAALLHHIHYNLKLLWLCGRPHVGRS